ncbi:MAG: bacteriohemerythrin [Pseudomonadota bacterium]
MTNELKLEWDPKFSVSIEDIDKYQQKMFEMFNQLLDLKKNKNEAKEYIDLISDINEFSKLYFGAEEKILRKIKYPDYAAHAKAHRQFTKNFISLRREIAEDVENLTDQAIVELREWLINHILELDSMYIPFIRITDYIEKSEIR